MLFQRTPGVSVTVIPAPIRKFLLTLYSIKRVAPRRSYRLVPETPGRGANGERIPKLFPPIVSLLFRLKVASLKTDPVPPKGKNIPGEGDKPAKAGKKEDAGEVVILHPGFRYLVRSNAGTVSPENGCKVKPSRIPGMSINGSGSAMNGVLRNKVS
jgi:hypothetical protein